jgi:AraC family transcriptional activator of tynA and feaB
METPLLPHLPSLLDLSGVDEDRRAGLWATTATSVFPGVSVDMPAAAPVGQIRSIPMGGGSIWSIVSAPVFVTYSPANGADDPAASISLLMQREGSMVVGQSHRACELRAGDMCLVDERFPFFLQGPVTSEIVFLRMPRQAVLGRHPYLEHRTAGLFQADDPGSMLLRDTLMQTVRSAPQMREDQRASVLSAMVHLLGAAATPRGAALGDVGWRVRAALAYIELNLAEGDLTADQVARAQAISRRRLDQVLLRALGLSVTGQIWRRRLEVAAADLVDPRYAGHSVSQIAFATGFEDAAHFSRAFKAKFGHAPRDWRLLGRAKAH